MDYLQAYFVWNILILFSVCHSAFSQEENKIFRSLFTRTAQHRLSSRSIRTLPVSSVETCARKCIQETQFQCKSFDFDNHRLNCILYTVCLDDPDVHLIADYGVDHYQSSYKRLFIALPNHMLSTTHRRRIPQISVEQCARFCVLETYFKCRGFDYRIKTSECLLSDWTQEDVGGLRITNQGVDYYERKSDGPLAEFINFGTGRMRQLDTTDVYQKEVMGVKMAVCATMCLDEKSFDCNSFDYSFDGAKSVCHLSKFISPNVYGLEIKLGTRVAHFERNEKFLKYFYASPYSVLLGNNHKTYTHVTPNRCARMCMLEEAFVCRSFDYQIKEGKCVLSSKTGSDVGGLMPRDHEIHHFEMKPLLDCGGNITGEEGDIASPNWPRNYAHHEKCVWHIQVPRYKVIHLKVTHFDLGLQSHDPCSAREDRVLVTELVGGDERHTCVMPNTKSLVSHTNTLQVSFYSNRQVDGQGFRAFFTAEWTCDTFLDTAPGEFASPRWPNEYPSSSRCSWRMSAPQGYRVRIRFTAFELEKHNLGHCNENFDHVRILDGGTINSPLIGLKCGDIGPMVVRSTGRDIFVQFRSDASVARDGFHAVYAYESQNTTIEVDDENVVQLDEDGKEKNIQGDKAGRSVAGSGDDSYKTTMWAIATTLFLLLVAAIILLVLGFRHYRRKLRSQENILREEIYEEVPLREPNPHLPNLPKRNNEVDMSGATGQDTSAFVNDTYDQKFQKNPDIKASNIYSNIT